MSTRDGVVPCGAANVAFDASTAPKATFASDDSGTPAALPHRPLAAVSDGPLAAVALHFGANDVQGTVVREEIFHAAGARTETEQKIDELVRYVREAGRIPVQRDTLYNELRRWQ